ncbi:class I SAM-dependent methyltransferase [Bacillus sp. EB600]|uniref:class I SAM-dependent DNA methyltransferase n=1 Tax=Bacillus sp. EB600 TaxID=2806345 RepID=UPI00210C0D1B|nr:class I SAM-dependent methyltransferase [Bacillus sp. EB600]MCQ6278174.1 methyltransferase domain-containing protein [Bacillus sp. EB600]
MSYEQFAYLYDELMQDAPYDKWVNFVVERLHQYDFKGKSLLDLACGTGELSVRFAKRGFDVTGVDLSSDMLSVARAKAEELGLRIPFFEQDMAELEGLGSFDMIGIFCDSLNYLQTEEKVVNTFLKAALNLRKDGILFFDVHSIFKITEQFIDHTFTLNDEHVAYIWDSFPGEHPNSVEHELSFFVLDERDGKYNRIDEFHEQRTFSIDQYSLWLEETGFEILEITADFEEKPPRSDSERNFFMARKK